MSRAALLLLACFQIISTHSSRIFKWQQLLPSLQGPAAGPMSPPYHHAGAFNSEDFTYPSWVTLGVRVLGSFISQFFEMQMKILVRLAKRLFSNSSKGMPNLLVRVSWKYFTLLPLRIWWGIRGMTMGAIDSMIIGTSCFEFWKYWRAKVEGRAAR